MSIIEEKLDSEWNTIQNIYDKNTHTIIGIIRPDFSVTRIIDQYCIGVEITRFYFHQASARLKNNSTYLSNVLLGNIMNEDKKILSVDNIQILGRKDEQGNAITFDGVIYTHPSIHDCLSLLANDIRKKNEKYKFVSGSFRKIELIITDEENCFSGWSIDQLSNSIFRNDELNGIIQFSLFNEIFFVSHLLGGKKVLPLKRALFLSRLFIITSYCGSKVLKQNSTNIDFILSLFSILKRFGYLSIKGFRDKENSCYLTYETTLIKITEAMFIGIRVIKYDADLDELSQINFKSEAILQNEIDFEDFYQFEQQNFANLGNFIIEILGT